jgi:hypothetical protein
MLSVKQLYTTADDVQTQRCVFVEVNADVPFCLGLEKSYIHPYVDRAGCGA